MSDEVKVVFKHEQLRKILKDKVMSGCFDDNDRFPSQNDLARDYSVSINTAREAVATLVNEGFLYKIRGSGTFITPKSQKRFKIGLMIPHLLLDEGDIVYENDIRFFLPLVYHMIQDGAAHNADILVKTSLNCNENVPDKKLLEADFKNVDELINANVNAIAIFLEDYKNNSKVIKKIKEANIPFVQLDRIIDSNESYIIPNHYQGTSDATKCLVDNNCDLLLHFTNNYKINPIIEKENAFLDVLKENKINNKNNVFRIEKSLDVKTNILNYCKLAKQVLSDSVYNKLGIYCGSGDCVTGVYKAIRELNIPSSKVVLSYNSEPYCSIPDDLLQYRVITDFSETAKEAIDFLINNDINKKITLRINQKVIMHKKNFIDYI